MLGYNYRLNEMSCAMGIEQIKRIKQIIKKRTKVAELYNRKLKDADGLEAPYVKEGNELSWFVYVVKLSKGINRNKVISEMEKRGIQCSNYFQSIHLQPFYQKMFGYKKGDFPVSEDVSNRTLSLPFYNDLSQEQIDFVARNLKEIIKNA